MMQNYFTLPIVYILLLVWSITASIEGIQMNLHIMVEGFKRKGKMQQLRTNYCLRYVPSYWPLLFFHVKSKNS